MSALKVPLCVSVMCFLYHLLKPLANVTVFGLQFSNLAFYFALVVRCNDYFSFVLLNTFLFAKCAVLHALLYLV